MGNSQAVLIVDDEPANIELLNEVLRDFCQVFFAVNGADALKVAREQNPDLIILDIILPEMDGFQVCERLKEDPATRDIPVIFITARHEEASETRGLALGAVDYISKPINPNLVSLRVKNQLELRRSRKRLTAQNRYIRDLIDHSLNMIISVDKEQNIVEFNQAAETAFGYSKAEVAGRRSHMLFADANKADMVAVFSETRGRFVGEVTFKRKNGEIYPAHLSSACLKGEKGEIRGSVCIARDISVEKKIQKLMATRPRAAVHPS